MLRLTRNGLALRPSAPSLMLRRTQPDLIPIPPFLIQIIKSVAVNAGQQFVQAHFAEAERLRRQREENERNNGHGQQENPYVNSNGGSSSSTYGLPRPKMTGEEALQILNINPNLAVPLRGNEDKARATENFKAYFAKAEETKSVYLQGKISQAYKMCVDDKWDRDKK